MERKGNINIGLGLLQMRRRSLAIKRRSKIRNLQIDKQPDTLYPQDPQLTQTTTMHTAARQSEVIMNGENMSSVKQVPLYNVFLPRTVPL